MSEEGLRCSFSEGQNHRRPKLFTYPLRIHTGESSSAVFPHSIWSGLVSATVHTTRSNKITQWRIEFLLRIIDSVWRHVVGRFRDWPPRVVQLTFSGSYQTLVDLRFHVDVCEDQSCKIWWFKCSGFKTQDTQSNVVEDRDRNGMNTWTHHEQWTYEHLWTYGPCQFFRVPTLLTYQLSVSTLKSHLFSTFNSQLNFQFSTFVSQLNFVFNSWFSTPNSQRLLLNLNINFI